VLTNLVFWTSSPRLRSIVRRRASSPLLLFERNASPMLQPFFFIHNLLYQFLTSHVSNMLKPCIELAEKLASLSLDQYYNVLTSNGFDDWESILSITEDDMERFRFKLGNRRKLLRAIATTQGHPTSFPLTDSSISKKKSSGEFTSSRIV
jgi:hypothetical protein